MIGRDGNLAKAKDTTLSAMQEASKKLDKYKMAEVLSNLVHDSDQGNAWNAVRSLRAMAAVVVRENSVESLENACQENYLCVTTV